MINSPRYPERTYLLSDVFGGQSTWNPFESPDIDAQITTDIRSRISNITRSFDILGAEKITDHTLRAVVKLHDESMRAGQDVGTTGVFINYAPRTTKGSNGKPFYVAETDNGVKIVTTPLEALSPIKERIITLKHLPNENNGLYDGRREQFRSSFTPILLSSNHGLSLENDSTNIIPDYTANCYLAYIDRFGNIVIYNDKNSDIGKIINNGRDHIGELINLSIGTTTRTVVVGKNLSESNPGELSLYGNDGNIEIVSKWDPSWSAKEKLRKSAAGQFGEPEIGSEVIIGNQARHPRMSSV